MLNIIISINSIFLQIIYIYNQRFFNYRIFKIISLSQVQFQLIRRKYFQNLIFYFKHQYHRIVYQTADQTKLVQKHQNSYQTFLLKDFLKSQSNSSPTSSKIALDQIIEEYTLVLYSTALLAQDNANLCTPNKKKYQKYTQSNRYIAHKEDLQLAQQQNQPVENNRLVALAQCELSIQHNKPAMRTLSSNGEYRETSHRINSYKIVIFKISLDILVEIS